MNNLPAKLIDEAVAEFMRLPGIGRRSALRMVLHLLRQPEADVERFGNTMARLKKETRYCVQCHNITDSELCSICADKRRDAAQVCVVEDIRDLIAIENTQQYRGRYHVLNGVISPMDGVGPSDLNVESLLKKVHEKSVDEIIIALSATMEGDTTAFFIYKKILQAETPVKFSILARGVSIGDELEYADEITLGRSIINRVPYETTFQVNQR
jgi:recombination protein RecR